MSVMATLQSYADLHAKALVRAGLLAGAIRLQEYLDRWEGKHTDCTPLKKELEHLERYLREQMTKYLEIISQ